MSHLEIPRGIIGNENTGGIFINHLDHRVTISQAIDGKYQAPLVLSHLQAEQLRDHLINLFDVEK